jgi:hypothetical protein
VGTTILFGLLRRSAVVLDEEFPTIGIAPGALSGTWFQELSEAIRQESNRRIASVDYDGASALSNLKSKFLSLTAAEAHRSRVGRSAQPAPVHDDASADAKKNAAQFATEALGSLRKETATPGARSRSWKRTARAGGVGLLVLLALALANMVLWDEGRVASAELAQVSRFLSDGKRNGDGAGTAFVGTLSDGWSELDAAQQAEAADSLVEALRERGIREIMIYDGDHRLRIQALGSQAARVVR